MTPSRRNTKRALVAALALALAVPTPALAQQANRAAQTVQAAPAHLPPPSTTADPDKAIDYTTPRYEPAGFPIVGGTSDIGVMAGAVFTLTRFEGNVRPYKWNMDLVVSASAKGGANGPEIIQQSYLWQLDVPGALGGGVRLNPAVSYERTINQGYYGIGNATPVFPTNAPSGDLSRYNQFIAQEARVRELTRIKLRGPLDLMVATTYRYVSPEAYVGSRVAQDAAMKGADGSPFLRGLDPLSLAQLGLGLVYDTRDNEFFPHRGMYHQAGVKGVQGLPFSEDVRYLEAGVILAGFVPLAKDVVLASRLLADAQFGNVPFYDLSRAGPFMSYDVIGGAQGVRGVPLGRYAGVAKVVGNVELRGMAGSFRVVGQSMRVGGDVFFDTGRAFSDYTFHAVSDGPGVGLKMGVGVGAFLQWGAAAVFRVDVAYSPDAVAENPKLPLGIYVQDGMMF